ncbi:MAG: hypothetical protein A2Z52_01375, partial [Candidatus Moranbacteria bacterium RBG_19FT_COMBO_42_6]
KKIVDLLIQNEATMGELYRVYAEKFPEYAKFWSDIHEDEKSHAAWINTLYHKLKAGMVSFSEQRFPISAIKENIKYIENEKAKTSQGEMSLGYALEKAVHIERGMIEHKFFDVLKDDSMELQILLQALRLGTEQHLQKVQKAWEKEKGGAEFEKLSA